MTTTNEAYSLEIKRTFHAMPRQVYQAWIDPKMRLQWSVPCHEKMTCTACSIDPRIGGQYAVTMHNDENGEDYIAVGEFKEMIEDKKLVFTWSWKDRLNLAQDTLCTIELKLSEDGKQTHMVFTHVGFPDESSHDDHMKGWNGCLSSLDYFLNK
ncbi:SRPBCC domain-containing protein [Planctomycetota bacterium]|nr:SRPBCC domain-containing protein [Planctomycetota bacterium]